ncbi:MAG TPA: FxSxx-COOH system tetratricopeptide repeat protein [Blastocatellia bacterium]|nr:FxSxx-COOH system tetratricopeptide repeat protein [Blastocatellia bacterium]
MKDFFISYNKADRTWAEWIAWQLEEADYSVVIQAWDFRPGGNFVLDMQDATADCERTIAVLSDDYLKSKFTAPEWAAAFAQDPTGEKGILLPVRVGECEPKGLLPQIVYIDLVNRDETTAKRALLGGVKRGRKKPDEAPGFPGSSRTIASKPRFPGSLPAIWNIPFLRNQNFTGREDDLAELRASLIAGETAALVQPRAIHGLGGIGKTQLSVEYAYRHGTDYDIVWWIRSEDPVTLASDYASLAVKLELPEKDATEQRVIVEAVKEWLRQNRDWLLIFDNAEDAESVRDYIPRGGMGHIIITSRNPIWAGVAKSLPVTSLPLDKAIEFLLKRTESKDETTAKTLAEAVGCLPLALEQASAYIETSGSTMARYLDLFEKRQLELLKRGKPSTEYPDTVATTWSISFQNVKKENEEAAEMLRLCAFFAPDDIPVKIIVEGAEELPKSLTATATDPILFDDALAVLRKYSLIEVEDEKISLHRLVQAVIRHAMNEVEFKKWAGVAVHVVNASFLRDTFDVRTWPSCLPLLPHATVALSHTEAVQFASNNTATLFSKIGVYLQTRAEYSQARRLLERALAIGEATLGLDHPGVATHLNNLGNVLREQGDLDSAKSLYERALAIDEATLGPHDPDVAIDLNNLGDVLQSQGDLDGAKSLYERALTIDEVALGPDHPYVANHLNNLGDLLREQGDLTGAKLLFERALSINESAFGSNHPNVALNLWHLGYMLILQNKVEDAKALIERALQIYREFLGDEHPTTKQIQAYLRLLEEKMKERG